MRTMLRSRAGLSQQWSSENICDVNENCSLPAQFWCDKLITNYFQQNHICLFLFAEFAPRGQGARTSDDMNSPDQRRFDPGLNAQPQPA